MKIFLCLVFAFVGSGSNSASGAGSGSGVSIGILYFIGNILLLKLLRTLSLAPKNNPMLFRKYFFSIDFTPLPKFFNSLELLLCSKLASSNDKYPSCISL